MKLRFPTGSPLLGTLLACALLFGACGTDGTDEIVVETEDTDETEDTAAENGGGDASMAEGTTRLWIMPELADCVGVAPQTCMQVAEAADGPYELFYDGIDGFTFIEGTSYVLDVTITEVADPPADGSSLAYTLVEIIDES